MRYSYTTNVEKRDTTDHLHDYIFQGMFGYFKMGEGKWNGTELNETKFPFYWLFVFYDGEKKIPIQLFGQ